VIFADVTGSGAQSMVFTRVNGAALEHFTVTLQKAEALYFGTDKKTILVQSLK
jgi:hypothetical protein